MLHSPSAPSEKSTPDRTGSWSVVGLVFILTVLFTGLAWQSLWENLRLAESLVSPASWRWLVLGPLGGELQATGPPGTAAAADEARVSTLRCLLLAVVLQLIGMAGLGIRSLRSRQPLSPRQILRLLGWWGLFAGWGLLWLFALIAQWVNLATFLQASVPFWLSLSLAGMYYEWIRLDARSGNSDSRNDSSGEVAVRPGEEAEPTSSPAAGKESPATETKPQAGLLWIAIGLYVLLFTAMNWGLWFNLRIPHGDSAMYEEHLWNVLQGKGFRSYLDQGLFWGEHIQFVHLFLLPLYVVWPSHLLLELCESTVIALGAWPVFRLATRASGSRQVGVWMGVAYLLYFPLQFLDIAVDLKTFRPIAFGMAPVLMAAWFLETRRYLAATAWLLFALTCKEDYAIVVFSIGVVLLVQAGSPLLLDRIRGDRKATRNQVAPAEPHSQHASAADSLRWKFGLGYLLFGPLYLWGALRTIRWFREGSEVHYAGYFSRFGESTGEIVWTMLTQPGFLLGELLTIDSSLYLLAMLVPIGFLPLLSPTRFLGCLPMLVLLCLNELAQDPRHHFHAPLIPLLFWSACGGLKHLAPRTNGLTSRRPTATNAARWGVCCGLATSLWFTLSPLGVPFWDPGSAWNGARLYWPNERARQFAQIADLIPRDARVASTDYVHPRFTHHERSYDYSQYARRVSDYELRVPPDTDYIVIDTRHPYSEIRHPEQIRELQQEPDEWELLPDQTDGYFLVLKRRTVSPAQLQPQPKE